MSKVASYSESLADTSVADVHLTKCSLPLPDTIERFLLLVPQQPDELLLVASAETFVPLQPVQQLVILVVELPTSFTFTITHRLTNSTVWQSSLPTFYGYIHDDSIMA